MTISLPSQAKRTAWELRQKDTGWGHVLAQSWVPFYWIYYAFSRRTITPLLHGKGFGLAAAFIAGVIVGATQPNTQQAEQSAGPLGTLACLLAAPIGFKIGTDSAREFAKQKLEEE
ncbi:MAG: hypothetical protein RL442_1816 [Pseudomonadota bacterium]|jgi:hypothetical protein